MTHRERAALALNRKVPDYVPTFELEYQLSEEVFGKPFLQERDLEGLSAREQEARIRENAEFLLHVYGELEYSIIPIHGLSEEHFHDTVRYLRSLIGDQYMLTVHGDGTFAIPPGDQMLEFVYRMQDEPEEVHRQARRMAQEAIERNHRMAEAGVDCFILCSDYCFNNGPFLSPALFEEFVQPYLYDIIKEIRRDGAYAIKHTDGNIMPILQQLVDCEPHALHSLDPMAGVDIREVKRLVGDRVCLCGNVHCAALQTGTVEEVVASAEYCMTYGKPGGGYIFCTSNIPFLGMPAERYAIVQEVWKRLREYDVSERDPSAR